MSHLTCLAVLGNDTYSRCLLNIFCTYVGLLCIFVGLFCHGPMNVSFDMFGGAWKLHIL